MNVLSERMVILKAGAGLALVGALALSACAPDDDPAAFEETEPASADESTEEATAEEEPEDEETEEPEGNTETESDLESEDEDDMPEGEDEGADGAEDNDASTGPLDPEDAIETVVYEVPGESGTTIEVGLHDLRIVDEVMLLELSFTGEFYGEDAQNIYNMFNLVAIYPELNDRENLKQYTVIGSGQNRWSTPSTNSGQAYESGQTAPYWAYYAAPVDDIDTITVTVLPGAIEFEDVEIDWAESQGPETDEEDGE